MENGQACSCFNGTQDEEGANYSAPVPVIGLYIAGATLVCLSLIVGDLVNAFRSRLFWVPCRFFTMNSFTLTVVGVVTKIPVDLTTPMPDGQDQLAKIYGTSLLFIFMVLFIPSVGKMTASERIPNLASLTLIVITVIVNICMQIGTGLIFKFVVEHVVIMVLMLLTLCIMWSSNTDVDTWLDANIDGTKDVVKYCQSRDGPGLDRDMKLFLLGKLNVPELLSCKFAHYPTMGILCATCFIVSSEATFRAALHQKTSSFFGQSVSDYKWSMWVLVGTQLVTTLVGSVSIGLKSLFLARQMKPFVFADKYNNFRSYQLTRSFMPLFRSYYLPKSLSGFCIPEISRGLQGVVSILQFIIDVGMEWTDQVLIFLVAHVLGIFKNRNRKEMEEREFHERFRNVPLESFPVKDLSFNKWLIVQSSNNTELLIEKERLRNPQSSPLIKLLSGYHARCASSMQQLDSMKIGTNEFILFVLLVEATYVLPPSDRTRSLVSTFDEVFDVLYFIGENPVTKDYVHDYTMWIGRDYWMRRKTSNHCFQGCLTRWRNKLNHDVGRILRTEGTISFFQRKISIGELLNIQENETLDALYERIEEQFIHLLLRFLNRLPDVIFKYIIEGSYKDFSERATMCLKFLCRLNLIDAKVQWSETNIISFITREATGVPSQLDAVAAPDGATALVLDHIIEVTSGESGSQTQTITDDYGSEIVHRIAASILALFNASRLTIGISGEEQGNQTIISSGDNSGIIIALIAASITSLIIALPPTTGVTGDEQGSQTFISMETFNDDYNQDIVFGVAARLAALILHLPLAIALAGDEQGSQAFITRETLTGVTGDKMREFCLRIALGIVALITASPPTVGVTGEDEQGSGSQTSTTSETLTDDYRRGNNDARVAAHIASLIITLPLTIELPNDEGDQGSQRETLTQEKVLHVLFIKLLSNSCWTSSRVGDEKANDIRRHVFQLMQDYSSQLQSSRSRRGTTTSDSQQLHYNN